MTANSEKSVSSFLDVCIASRYSVCDKLVGGWVNAWQRTVGVEAAVFFFVSAFGLGLGLAAAAAAGGGVATARLRGLAGFLRGDAVVFLTRGAAGTKNA